MPIHNFQRTEGRIVEIEIDSPTLSQNLLQDPARRTVAVYLPKGYDKSDRYYPLLLYLASYGSSGLKKLAWQRFGENLPQRMDRLVRGERIPPVIAVFPDCFTSLGGNQYVNSSVLGNWEDFLLEDLLPHLEERLRVAPGARHRAVIGYSSGGYGALVQGLRHGEAWAALASHSGDIGFENVFRGEFPRVVTQLTRAGGSIQEFLQSVKESRHVEGHQLSILMILANAAAYDPAPDEPSGLRLPVSLETCELLPNRWANWLRHDPLEMILQPECQQNLARVRKIYLDCGKYDQYHLQYGSRLFSERLNQAGIAHVYEEFEDDHNNIEYRLDRSLPMILQGLVE